MAGNTPPWTPVHGRGRARGRGRSSSQNTRRSSYDSSFPVIQLGNKKLINTNISEASSSSSSNINLKDIPPNSPLYEQLQAYLQNKQTGDTYASLTKEAESKRIFEEAPTKEIIFLLENSDIQDNNKPSNIFQR